MFLRSIRFRIIGWYVLLLAITLAVFSALIYHNFRRSLYTGLDDLLQSRAEGIADSIYTYWEAEKLDASGIGLDADVFTKNNDSNFAKIAQLWVKEKYKDPQLVNITVHLFDSQGRNIANSKNIPSLNRLSREAKDFTAKGNGYFNNIHIDEPGSQSLAFRVLTIPVIENTKVFYIVRIAVTLDQTYSELRRLRLILFLVLPLTVALTAVPGAYLAKKTLSPIREMMDSIHKITAQDLRQRVALPDTSDEIRRLAETFNDMLERIEATFRRERSFVQDISHSIKTPLTILKGELEVALRQCRPVNEYETVLQSSLDEINRMTKIVENLLFLVRFDNQETVLKLRPLEINAFLREIRDSFRTLAEEKNIGLSFEATGEIILEADENQLRQLFFNLLDNAVKYVPSGGKICVSVGRDSGFAMIKVTDNGIGISASDLPHIFDRFYRAQKSSPVHGFGLGLSIAKAIACAHRGKIEAQSQPGIDTSFTIYLPLPLR